MGGGGNIDELPEPSAADRRVTDDSVLNDGRAVVLELSVGHAQGAEDVFVGEFAQALAADAPHDLGQQHVIRITVDAFFARFKVQPLLPGDQLKRFYIAERFIRLSVRHCH